MKIESTPARTARMTKPKLEHVIDPNHKNLSIRNIWHGHEKGLEIKFDTDAEREVILTLSKEDTDHLILFIVETVIPAMVRRKTI